MFRPEKMSFVNISVLDEYLTPVLDRLAKMGVMHIVDKAELAPGTESLEDIDTTPIRNKLAELANRAGELLTALSIEISFTFTSSGMSKDKIEIDPFKITERIEKDLSEIEAVVKPLVQRQNQIQSEILTLEAESQQLSALEAQGVNIDDLREPRFLYVAFGDVPTEYYRRLVESLANV